MACLIPGAKLLNELNAALLSIECNQNTGIFCQPNLFEHVVCSLTAI